MLAATEQTKHHCSIKNLMDSKKEEAFIPLFIGPGTETHHFLSGNDASFNFCTFAKP